MTAHTMLAQRRAAKMMHNESGARNSPITMQQQQAILLAWLIHNAHFTNVEQITSFDVYASI